ncbi:hypothetical protein EZS27_020396 [termite gut metagenome]|uniref:BAR domain-containing protein n=1 Tax=termite gut metagenome TaxID=433724 RepID=A0A5J4RB07_9ZZZZ
MSNELIKINEVTFVLQSFGEIVQQNNASLEKCNQYGQTLLDTIEGNGGMTDELDKSVAEYLKKAKVTIENLGSRRKPITQVFDQIRGFFITQEKSIDPKDFNTVPGRLSQKRDEYAKFKYEQEQARKREQARLAQIENEKAAYRNDLENGLLTHFNQYLNAKKAEVTSPVQRHFFIHIRAGYKCFAPVFQ